MQENEKLAAIKPPYYVLFCFREVCFCEVYVHFDRKKANTESYLH